MVAEERYWYPEDGGVVWLAGYTVVDPDSGAYLARDAPELAARGLRIAGVAGAARHHAEALASDAAAPGRPLVLRRDAANEHDANAIAVDRRTARSSAGCRASWRPSSRRSWTPARRGPRVALREQRASPRDPRTGVTMLLAAAPSIALVVRVTSATSRAKRASSSSRLISSRK